MEGVDEGRRGCREVSAEMCGERKVMMMKPTLNKVEVVYYLSRSNGHLDHPHFIEVTHLAHQQLRLKDVLDRLTVLRGKGMPSLYSWSCKRSYKNGYVWNDLAQSDVIFPIGGGEYVLKGSELPLGYTEKLHHLQLGNVEHFQHENNHQRGQDSNFPPKRRFLASKRQTNHQEMMSNQYDRHPQEEAENEDKTMHTRCSRGVSTEDIKHQKHTTVTELNLGKISLSSPPSTTSSSTLSDSNPNDHNSSCKRSEDGDPIGNEPMLSRNSMLYNLIACGGSGSFRKNVLPPRMSDSGGGSSLQKGVVCRVTKMGNEDEMMINYMSENPRFGNLQSEEKEYFSGSIVESIADEKGLGVRPALKKSSSCNQERSSKAGLGEVAAEEVKEDKGMKGKCIPRKKKKPTSKQSKIER